MVRYLYECEPDLKVGVCDFVSKRKVKSALPGKIIHKASEPRTSEDALLKHKKYFTIYFCSTTIETDLMADYRWLMIRFLLSSKCHHVAVSEL